MDIAVRWDDGTINIVSENDIATISQTPQLTNGKRVLWKADSKWKGEIIESFAGNASDTSNDTDSEDGIPIADLIRQQKKDSDDDIPLVDLIHKSHSDSDPEEDDSVVDPDFQMDISTDSSTDSESIAPISNHQNTQQKPIDFKVEGAEREGSNVNKRNRDKRWKGAEVKAKRNKGEEYTTEKSNQKKQARNHTKGRCSSQECVRRGLDCGTFSEEQRNEINRMYYSLENLEQKRLWLGSMVEVTALNEQKKGRKNRTILYHLPLDANVRARVCRVMFYSTVNISEKQVRTVLALRNSAGAIAGESRGGRTPHRREHDQTLNECVRQHIKQFPRMESHYCRSSSTYEYLSSELTVGKMHRMFTEENPNTVVSFSLYLKVFRSLNLRFSQPKKDLCGLCEAYHQTPEAERSEDLKSRYKSHTEEKNKVRELKEQLKAEALINKSCITSSFDLQQVIYVPRSNRCELFYKRRLACYNFTVYDLGSRDASCYLWHEGVACRGANEVASAVNDYLSTVDRSNAVTKVSMFADGCVGQNKNSIIASMMIDFVKKSKHIRSINMYYFETNHGQNEGDAVHSAVERALDRQSEVVVPSQLFTVIRSARINPRPYNVINLVTEDIVDWKAYSVDRGILRNRVADDGATIDWPKVMQLQFRKERTDSFSFKHSHMEPEFHEIHISRRQSGPISSPAKAFSAPPKITKPKFDDLKSLCAGVTPVVRLPEHQAFFKGLTH